MDKWNFRVIRRPHRIGDKEIALYTVHAVGYINDRPAFWIDEAESPESDSIYRLEQKMGMMANAMRLPILHETEINGIPTLTEWEASAIPA